MTSSIHTQFGAILANEVRLHSKRVAPYALLVLFVGVAVMGWARGPALSLGWATNSDFYIARGLKAFSFLFGLPIFNAVIMGDAVIRDFRVGIDPLIFSKPVTRAQYLFGKFCGNFFVLVCCMSAYPLTQLLLQAVPFPGMVVQPAKVLPYFQHFLFFVVITQLTLAAAYFTVGTLTRSSKIVYGLAVCFYPIYIAAMLFIFRVLGLSVRSSLDMFLLNSGPSANGFGHSAEFLNQYVFSYTPGMIGNRVVLIFTAVVCLGVLYFRFSHAQQVESGTKFSVLNLAAESQAVIARPAPTEFPAVSAEAARALRLEPHLSRIALPKVTLANERFVDALKKLPAAIAIEFRLLRSERSLIVLLPLALVLPIFEVAFFPVVPDISYSATYATNTASGLLIFLVGMSVFYTGEGMHRDREARIDPLLWAAPAPNYVLYLSKFCATLGLTFALMVVVGLLAVLTQLIRGHPIDLQPYLLTYTFILAPSAIFLAAFAVMLNVMLRDKYVSYAVSIGLSAGLFYLYTNGHTHWLYNPLAFHIWNYSDLIGPSAGALLMQRFWWVLLALMCLGLARLCFRRQH